MHWQDAVFTAGLVAFAAALVPMYRHGRRPPVSTTAMTGLVQLAFAVTFATLGLWGSAAGDLVLALGWLGLLA